eukprot:jgi/Mesen1/1722/ME000138S00577
MNSEPGYVSWGGAFSCVGGAALYWLSNQTGRDAEKLRSIKKVNYLIELAGLLESSRKNVVPLIVAVAGRVGSATPISCEHSSLRGVILQETAEQHYVKNNSGTWVQDSELVLRNSKIVPWYLEDGTAKVHVVGLGAGAAAGLELTTASEVFEDSGRSVVRGAMDYLQGFKVSGWVAGWGSVPLPGAIADCFALRLLRLGWLLRLGLGRGVDVSTDDKGALRIQRPAKGPFYVTRASLDELIATLGSWSWLYKWLAVGCTALGVLELVSHAVSHFLQKRRAAALQRRVAERMRQGQIRSQSRNAAAAAAAAAVFPASDSEGMALGSFSGAQAGGAAAEKADDDSATDICVLCLENQYNAVFVPCGHMCCCTVCASQLRNCPLCRKRIVQAVKTYRH